jgi:hypothetical protein
LGGVRLIDSTSGKIDGYSEQTYQKNIGYQGAYPYVPLRLPWQRAGALVYIDRPT